METGGEAAFFTPDGDGLVPTADARSPWSTEMLHGRLLSGLAARAVETEIAHDPLLSVVRLTVDMFRFPPLDRLRVSSQVPRRGRRVVVVDVSFEAGDREVARARAVALRSGPHPQGEVWTPEPWDVAGPDELEPPEGAGSMGGWEIRPVNPGGFYSSDRKRLWTRDRWPLVAGEELSPVVRAALAADLPNPMANAGAGGLNFINADLTLSLARHPESEWIGLEVSGHLGRDGVAIGACTMYDSEGAIGWSSVCAVANEWPS